MAFLSLIIAFLGVAGFFLAMSLMAAGLVVVFPVVVGHEQGVRMSRSETSRHFVLTNLFA